MEAIDFAWRGADAEWTAAGRELAALLEAARRRGGGEPLPGDALPSSGWRVLARAPLGDGEPGSGWGEADLWALRASAGGPGGPGGAGAAGPGRVALVATAAPVPFRPVEAAPRARADLERLREGWRARLRGLEALLAAAGAAERASGGDAEDGGGGRVVRLAPAAAGPAARGGPDRGP